MRGDLLRTSRWREPGSPRRSSRNNTGRTVDVASLGQVPGSAAQPDPAEAEPPPSPARRAGGGRRGARSPRSLAPRASAPRTGPQGHAPHRGARQEASVYVGAPPRGALTRSGLRVRQPGRTAAISSPGAPNGSPACESASTAPWREASSSGTRTRTLQTLREVAVRALVRGPGVDRQPVGACSRSAAPLRSVLSWRHVGAVGATS